MNTVIRGKFKCYAYIKKEVRAPINTWLYTIITLKKKSKPNPKPEECDKIRVEIF